MSFPATQPRQTYLICTTHRSGSNLLCSLLSSTRVAGLPDEYFSPRLATKTAKRLSLKTDPEAHFAAFFNEVLTSRQTENGVFGAKMMWKHMLKLQKRLLADPEWKEKDLTDEASFLRRVFPNLKCVWLRREDKLRQAISMIKAKQTKQFMHESIVGISTRGTEAHYDYEAICQQRQRFEQQDASWESFIKASGFPMFALTYEQFVVNQESNVRGILDFLEIPWPSGFQLEPSVVRKQSDETNDTWLSQFLADKAAKNKV